MKAALQYILTQPWAMTPEMVDTIIGIADRTNDGPEAVASRLGRPLDNTRTVSMHGATAVIPVRGPISRYADLFSEISGATSVETLARDFRAALDDPAVSGIVLEIDSPGGQAAGIGELAAMIRAGSKVKPVTSYVSSMGASAALWIASAGSSVVCAPQAIMGSMGVVWPVSLPRTDAKAPRTIEFVSSVSPNKRPDPETDSGRAQMQAVVDSMGRVFVESVAGYRGLEPGAAIKQFNRGGVLVGRACVDAGMADRLGSLESCIDDMNRKAGVKAAKARPAYMNEAPMKFNMSNVITRWLGMGKPEVMESADLVDASAPDEDEGAEPVAQLNQLVTEIKTDPAVLEAAIAKAREDLRAEMAAELRTQRVALYKEQANAFLSLLGGQVTPGELNNLQACFVAASLIDAESPVDGFSLLAGFKAVIAARAPHGATVENVTGTAAEIAAHLSASGLKTLGNQVSDPAEAKAAAEQASIDFMLASTDAGRAILAERAARAK